MTTHNDLILLQAPFHPTEHRFNNSNWAYVDETAIIPRIRMVDMSWSTTQVQNTTRKNTISEVSVAVTINGITHTGLGQSEANHPKLYKDSKQVVDDYGNKVYNKDVETNEPAKGAATDALRRAGRYHGLGFYLMHMPKNDKGKPSITTHNALGRWLNDNFTGVLAPYVVFGKGQWWNTLKAQWTSKEEYLYHEKVSEDELIQAIQTLEYVYLLNLNTISQAVISVLVARYFNNQ